METQDKTLDMQEVDKAIRDLIDFPRRHDKRPVRERFRSHTELRLRDALILLRLYKKAAPQLTELNARVERWMKRQNFQTHAGRVHEQESRKSQTR
jgi:hypothetical protein